MKICATLHRFYHKQDFSPTGTFVQQRLIDNTEQYLRD